jgi:hypothetical protein
VSILFDYFILQFYSFTPIAINIEKESVTCVRIQRNKTSNISQLAATKRDSLRSKYLLAYSMEQSPSWEAKMSWATQEIPRILWNPNVHHRTHKSPPPVPVLGQIDPVHAPPSNLSKIHFNIILPSTPGSFYWPPSLKFPH